MELLVGLFGARLIGVGWTGVDSTGASLIGASLSGYFTWFLVIFEVSIVLIVLL